MSKNIVVFSDGTGQEGGVRAEQRMSNVYKLYRACRVSAENGINPAEQVSFYDPGLGTETSATGMTDVVRKTQKLLASVSGKGITSNIADCYEFIINHYQTGDRIFLFGFSRGAYTVRSIANLLMLCGREGRFRAFEKQSVILPNRPYTVCWSLVRVTPVPPMRMSVSKWRDDLGRDTVQITRPARFIAPMPRRTSSAYLIRSLHSGLRVSGVSRSRLASLPVQSHWAWP